MTSSVLPLLRRAAACLNDAFCTSSARFAIVVAVATAIVSSH